MTILIEGAELKCTTCDATFQGRVVIDEARIRSNLGSGHTYPDGIRVIGGPASQAQTHAIENIGGIIIPGCQDFVLSGFKHPLEVRRGIRQMEVFGLTTDEVELAKDTTAHTF